MVFLLCLMATAEVPQSQRSREVMQRVTPSLQKELQTAGVRWGAPVFVRIFKQPGTLELWLQKGTRFHLFRRYPICRFSGRLGPKLKEGDRQAPEGCYFVTASRMNPNSRFHLSFNLGYPNTFDRQHGRTGSALMVHGACASIGCYAMGDPAIEEIWSLCAAALDGGQRFFRVHCFPFALTPPALAGQTSHRWYDFWENLRPIYARFEEKRLPPNVVARDGRYVMTD